MISLLIISAFYYKLNICNEKDHVINSFRKLYPKNGTENQKNNVSNGTSIFIDVLGHVIRDLTAKKLN
jgi:hypothetical protein